MKKIIPIILASAVLTGNAKAESDFPLFQTVVHNGYSLIMDCVARAPFIFQYRLGKDVWDEPSSNNFDFDPKLQAICQQTSNKAYGHRKGTLYERGQLVGVKAMDNTRTTMEEAFYISNVVPQASVFRTGAWRVTELYQECMRKESEIVVTGGVVFNNDDNDFFMRSHNIKTPDLFWKLIVTGAGYYAWVFPNSNEASASATNNYLASIEDIQELINFDLGLGGLNRLTVSELPADVHKCL